MKEEWGCERGNVCERENVCACKRGSVCVCVAERACGCWSVQSIVDRLQKHAVYLTCPSSRSDTEHHSFDLWPGTEQVSYQLPPGVAGPSHVGMQTHPAAAIDGMRAGPQDGQLMQPPHRAGPEESASQEIPPFNIPPMFPQRWVSSWDFLYVIVPTVVCCSCRGEGTLSAELE